MTFRQLARSPHRCHTAARPHSFDTAARPHTALALGFATLLTVFALGAPARGEAASATLTYYPSGSTDEIYLFSLADGTGQVIDRARREPRQLRSRRLAPSLFEAVGRPPTQAAIVGEIHLAPIHNGASVRAVLLVEASTGYVAYFEDFGKGEKLGQPVTTMGRPFEAIRSTDGNFALLPRRDGSGRTQDAYLYHATTGRVARIGDLAKLEIEPSVRELAPLPALQGLVTVVPLEIDDGETVGWLAIDNATGVVSRVAIDTGAPDRLAPLETGLDLFQALPREAAGATARRFVAIGLAVGQVTRSALVVDAASGKTALIENLGDPGASPTLRPLRLDLISLLGPESPRAVVAVPATSGGGTSVGAWFLVGSPPRFFYVDGLEDPATASAASVRVDR